MNQGNKVVDKSTDSTMNQGNKVELESDQINSQKECTVNPSETATKRKHSETESETEVEVTKRKKDLYSEFTESQKRYFNRYIENTANFIESALEDYLLDEDFKYEDFEEEHWCFFGHGQTPIYWLKFFFCVESLSEDEKKKYNHYFENVLRKSDINIHGLNPNTLRRKRFINVMGSHYDCIQYDILEREYTLKKINEDRYKLDLLKSFYTNVMKQKNSDFTIDAVLPMLQSYQGKKVTMRMEERYRSYGDEDDAPCCSTMEKTGYCAGH